MKRINNDDLTIKIMFREVVYVSKTLEMEHKPKLLKNPELNRHLITIRLAANDALADYGVFGSKRAAPFTLSGLAYALEAVRKELEETRKGKSKKKSQQTAKGKIWRILEKAAEKALRMV